MIEWINETFGIKNEVSVPTMISLIVFILGGTINYLFTKLKEYNRRRVHRKTFKQLLLETIKDLNVKEKSLAEFYPQVDIKHEGHWTFSHRNIGYLDTVYEFDFMELYYSFRRKYILHPYKKIKLKAFHRIWKLLKGLKFSESQVLLQLDRASKESHIQLGEFNDDLEKYREFKERQHHEIQKSNQEKIDFPSQVFLDIEKDITEKWFDLGEIRTHRYYLYHNFVVPLLEHHREFSSLPITLESAQILIQSELKFKQLESTLRAYNKIFKNYWYYYRRDRRLLSTYLKYL
tara:strand:+ start:193 stop:1062 length:870 start_codon:yes stop_codon:yes gene_type:complete